MYPTLDGLARSKQDQSIVRAVVDIYTASARLGPSTSQAEESPLDGPVGTRNSWACDFQKFSPLAAWLVLERSRFLSDLWSSGQP